MTLFDNVSELLEDKATKERNTIQLVRECEIFILKRIRIEDDRKFRRQYKEFLDAGLLKKAINISNAYINYYAVQTGTTGKNSAHRDFRDVASLTDVISISINNSTDTVGTANLTLKNLNKKYEFTEYLLKKGHFLFDPNDEVIIRLPGLDSKLYWAFKGFINNVNYSSTDGGMNNSISLFCENMLKKLKISRTNISPSANPREAKATLIAFKNPFIGKQVHEVVKEILGRVYIDWESDTDTRNAFTLIDGGEVATSGGTSGAEYRGVDAQKSIEKDTVIQENIANFIVTRPLDAASTTTPQGIAGRVTAPVTTGESRVPTEIWGFSSRDIPTSTNEVLLANNIEILNFKASNLSFIVSGTNQPPFQIEFNKGWNLFESDFRTNYDLLQQICKNVFFECYADARGVVRVSPLNITLPSDSKHLEGRAGSEYTIEDRQIIADSLVETDNGVVTVIYVKGDFLFVGDTQPSYLVNAIYDYKLYRKYGWRVAPQVTIPSVTQLEALARYGLAILDRMNRFVSSGSITIIGDARIDIGNPIYYKSKNKVYYVRGIQHNYVPGQGYTTTLDLVYGRSPLCFTDRAAERIAASLEREGKTKEAAEVLRNKYSTFITLPVSENNLDIEAIYSDSKSVASSRKERVEANIDNLTLGDYVWEDISELDYDSLLSGDTVNIRRASYYKEIETDIKLEGDDFIRQFKDLYKRNPISNRSLLLYTYTKERVSETINLIK